jgi:hypothetical protein
MTEWVERLAVTSPEIDLAPMIALPVQALKIVRPVLVGRIGRAPMIVSRDLERIDLERIDRELIDLERTVPARNGLDQFVPVLIVLRESFVRILTGPIIVLVQIVLTLTVPDWTDHDWIAPVPIGQVQIGQFQIVQVQA